MYWTIGGKKYRNHRTFSWAKIHVLWRFDENENELSLQKETLRIFKCERETGNLLCVTRKRQRRLFSCSSPFLWLSVSRFIIKNRPIRLLRMWKEICLPITTHQNMKRLKKIGTIWRVFALCFSAIQTAILSKEMAMKALFPIEIYTLFIEHCMLMIKRYIISLYAMHHDRYVDMYIEYDTNRKYQLRKLKRYGKKKYQNELSNVVIPLKWLIPLTQ